LLIGGLIFKYLDILKKIANIRNILLLLIFSFILAFSVYFYLSNYQSLIGLLLVTSCTIVVAISLNFKHGLGRYLLSNKLMCFLSSISMEIYLCHMVIFRGWEKFGLTAVTENHILQYIITSVLTVLGAIAFSYTLKSCISLVSAKFHCNK
jgi:peptidoglycan/LPS O-acetylase OafA/YrhL